MKRLAIGLCVLACALSAPAAHAVPLTGTITGRITNVGSSTLTVQTAGPRIGEVNALTRAADALAAGDYPYVWGGGHPLAGVASVGVRGPGYNGHRRGFDCSGSIAAVLSAAGLWPAGSGVPGDYGVIQYLARNGLISRGPGPAPTSVNLYDDPGVHIFMSIDGRYFGTSDGGGGNSQGGPTWLDDSAALSASHAYRRWHFQPWVLRNRVIYGHSYTFQTVAHPELAYGAETGERVTVGFSEWPTGSMGLRLLTYAGAATLTGTVTAIDAATLTVQSASGQTVTFATSLVAPLVGTVQIGDGVQISYSTDPAQLLVPHALQVTSTPPPSGPSSPSSPPPSSPPPPGGPAGAAG
ncbi:MAG TPA: hypothetical protein VF781_13995 [Solirubrobacteraceae bacterium]